MLELVTELVIIVCLWNGTFLVTFEMKLSTPLGWPNKFCNERNPLRSAQTLGLRFWCIMHVLMFSNQPAHNVTYCSSSGQTYWHNMEPIWEIVAGETAETHGELRGGMRRRYQPLKETEFSRFFVRHNQMNSGYNSHNSTSGYSWKVLKSKEFVLRRWCESRN